MKRISLKLATLTAALLLLSNISNSFAEESKQPKSCSELHKKLEKAFPNVLIEQPTLKALKETLGDYTKKEKVGTRYEWEQDDFMLTVQESQGTTSVSIIPEKIETPGKPIIHMPEAFQALLRTPPPEALAQAQKTLTDAKSKHMMLYQYSWRCTADLINPKTKQPTHSAIHAEFDDQGNFIALLY